MNAAPVRYSFGGDEHLFAEVSESMSLEAFFRGMAITRAVEQQALPGVLDICLANASFQIRFNPDQIAPEVLLEKVRELEAQATAERSIQTRIIEIPVLYNDPWTHETLMRFRDRHQDPSSTDLEYAAKVNGFADVQAFIEAHSGSPWFVSMVGFVAGLPFMYQMFGVTPAPIYDPQQSLGYLKDSMVFFRSGDIVQFKPIDRAAYDQAVAEVEAGTFQLRIRPVSFDLDAFIQDPQGCKQRLQEVLHVD
jgi:allophanate hydrolase subunit 1